MSMCASLVVHVRSTEHTQGERRLQIVEAVCVQTSLG